MGLAKVFRKIKGFFSKAPSTSQKKAGVMQGKNAAGIEPRAPTASAPHTAAQTPFRSENILGESTSHSVPELSTTRGTGYDAETVSATTQPGGAYQKAGSLNMFGNNNFIQGGTFTLVNNTTSPNSERPGFKTLQQHTAPAAFHNSVQHVDPPRCHPETRVEILQSIYDWIVQSGDREHWLLWLNGAAGAGKSAIMRTTIENCIEKCIATASFFFGRTDGTRNTMDPLVATLVYQLIRSIPNISEDVLHAIELDPFVFAQSIEYQFDQLIIQPLVHLPKESRHPFVIFIDGLDECLDPGHQSNLIRILGDLCNDKNIPVIFVIASRREPQILSEFGMPIITSLLEIVPLDNSEASDDIRRYLDVEFMRIKKTHPFRHLLASDWPSVSIINELVDKASGQFIFAAVVIRYLSSPRANPGQQLKVIRDLRLHHPSSEHPFAHLDSLYRHIFSQVELLDDALNVLAFKIITKSPNLNGLEPLGGNPEVLLVDLAPVLLCARDNDGYISISFLHASLPDFLQDQSRSQKYFLNLDAYCTKLLCMFFEQSVAEPFLPGYTWNVVARQEYWRLDAIRLLLEMAMVSDQLQCAVMKFKSAFHAVKIYDEFTVALVRVEILRNLKNLDFGDKGQAYQYVLDIFAEGYAKFWDSHTEEVKNAVMMSRDLCAQICQLRPDLEGDPLLDP